MTDQFELRVVVTRAEYEKNRGDLAALLTAKRKAVASVMTVGGIIKHFEKDGATDGH